MDAVTVLTQAITNSLQPVTIVALGPLTNLAEALLTTPSLVEKIARIVIMGGALRVAGNIRAISPRIDNPYAEWNIFHNRSLVVVYTEHDKPDDTLVIRIISSRKATTLERVTYETESG